MSLGLYLSIPFCRAKCTFCNFASDAFAPGRLPAYLDALCAEIERSRERAGQLNACLPSPVDTIYFGGGTPSLLAMKDVHRIFDQLRMSFAVTDDAEITVECAPGQLTEETLAALVYEGVNRISFGVQSFVDRETAAVGRLHTAAACLAEIDRVRVAGITDVGLDLIAGLPHQTEASWIVSLEQAIAVGVPHISVYLLEVDEDSRLGAEVLSSGSRYGAARVPSDEETSQFYEIACERLEPAGLLQYEISNFARPGFRSQHNLKYWQRRPYLGFGLDAHSMLVQGDGRTVRFANTDDLDDYTGDFASYRAMAASSFLPFRARVIQVPSPEVLTPLAELEETLFLGLRTNEGLCLRRLEQQAPGEAFHTLTSIFAEAEADGLLRRIEDQVALTPRGRLLSNEVFGRLLLADTISPSVCL